MVLSKYSSQRYRLENAAVATCEQADGSLGLTRLQIAKIRDLAGVTFLSTVTVVYQM